MTDAELIARLREGATWDDDVAAADRIEALTAKVKLMDDLDVINGEKIEALTKERDEAMQLLQTLSNMNGDLSRDMYKTKLLLAKAVEALGSIELYGSDTLSGRTDGPADAKWHREGVKEMRDRARATLAEIEGEKG